MYISRRKRRIERLKNQGFTHSEAKEIAAIKKYPHYIVSMIGNRASQQSAAKKRGMTDIRFKQHIRAQYVLKDWVTDGKLDVWKMIRAWEDKYKTVHPSYKTPDVKKKSVLKDFHFKALDNRPSK